MRIPVINLRHCDPCAKAEVECIRERHRSMSMSEKGRDILAGKETKKI